MERVSNWTFDESELCFRRDVRCLGISVSLIWFSCGWPFASPGKANHRLQEPFKISIFIIYLVWMMISNFKLIFFLFHFFLFLFHSLPILELEKATNDSTTELLCRCRTQRRCAESTRKCSGRSRSAQVPRSLWTRWLALAIISPFTGDSTIPPWEARYKAFVARWIKMTTWVLEHRIFLTLFSFHSQISRNRYHHFLQR